MAKSLQINVTLDSNRDSKLLENILLLLANHDSSNVTLDTPVEHVDQQPSDSVSTCSSPADICNQEQVEESPVNTSNATRDIQPEVYLNESELALLPARRAVRQQRNKHLHTPTTPTKIMPRSSIAGPHAASQELHQVSEYWLESETGNTALQEWLARKNKENRHRMRQLTKQKREIEKVLRQKEAEARERARKAQDSYRSWVDNKEQSGKDRTLISTPRQSTFSIEGIRSPTSAKQAPNPRLRKLKKSISYDEWIRTKKQPNQRTKLNPSASPNKGQCVKDQTSYSEWLASKNKQKCELKKAEKVDRQTDILKPFTQPKKGVFSRKSWDCFGNTGLKRQHQKVQAS